MLYRKSETHVLIVQDCSPSCHPGKVMTASWLREVASLCWGSHRELYVGISANCIAFGLACVLEGVVAHLHPLESSRI